MNNEIWRRNKHGGLFKVEDRSEVNINNYMNEKIRNAQNQPTITEIAQRERELEEKRRELFGMNYDPYNQPEEVIKYINSKNYRLISNYQELLDDYETGSDFYIDVIKDAQRGIANKRIREQALEKQKEIASMEKNYNSAKRELEKLRKNHSTRIGQIEYLHNFIKDYESKHSNK